MSGGQLRLGTFLAGALLTAIGAVLLTEGLGWWELRRSGLPYLMPAILILIGTAVVVSALGPARRFPRPVGSLPGPDRRGRPR